MLVQRARNITDGIFFPCPPASKKNPLIFLYVWSELILGLRGAVIYIYNEKKVLLYMYMYDPVYSESILVKLKITPVHI